MASSNKTVRFVIKTVTEGGKEVEALGVNVKDLAEMITATQRKTAKGVKIKAEAIGFDAITNMISKLNTVIQDLSGAYKVQEQAETKLAQAMKNTMGASEDEIQSIKDLCSAQQSLGVIGDEVQLQGVERLSTYLQTSEALKELIPLMNDLTVKQYGMDASGNDAASSAAILGKAMQGNVTALKRMGIEFSDAQKVILEYGTEAEKVALLIDVVGSKVGGMNAEVAKTDSGKMKQFENRLGDLKEMAGQVTSRIAPLFNGLSQLGNAMLGVSTLVKSFNALLPITSKVMDFASASAKKLGISLRGMMIASGVGVAIAALTFVIEKLIDVSDKASDSLDNLSEAEKRAKERAEEFERINKQAEQTAKQNEMVLRLNISRLKEFNGTKEEEKKLVKEMNSLYGESMGYFSSVSSWYKALTENSEEYCRQLIIQAKTQAMVQQITDLESKRDEVIKKINQGEYSNTAEVDHYEKIYEPDKKTGKERYRGLRPVFKTTELEDAKKEALDLTDQIAEANNGLNELVKAASSISFSVKGSSNINIIDTEKVNKETEQVAKAEEKAQQERIKAKTEADKILKDIEKKYSDEAIALIRDDDKRKRAEINKAYFDRMELINQKEKELSDLRIAEGKEGLDESEKELFKYARDLAQQTRERALNELNPMGKEGIKTFEQLSTALSYWNDKFNKASEEEREQIRKNISELENLKSSFELDSNLFEKQKEIDNLKDLEGKQYKIEVKAVGLDGWLDKMNEMQRIMSNTSATEKQKEAAAKLKEEYRQLAADSINYMDKISASWGNIKGLGNSIQSLTEALNGQKNAWETVSSVIDSAMAIYQSFMQVMQMVNTLSEIFTFNKEAEAVATRTATAVKVEGAAEEVAAEGAVISANSAATTSEITKASAETFAAHASIPWVGIAIAGDMVAAMLATMLSLPKFADGGIISGPTIGLMGEYAGASNNPEVVAPLSDLKSMLGETSGDFSGKVVFKIDGRYLKGVLERVNRFDSRTK